MNDQEIPAKLDEFEDVIIDNKMTATSQRKILIITYWLEMKVVIGMKQVMI